MSSVAIYPGTFDPMTHGHMDIIVRAAKVFDRIVIGVVADSNKQTILDIETRLKLVQTVCQALWHVEVKPFDGLLVSFAQAQQASVVVRGVRTSADFNYEAQMALINRGLNADIETVILPAAPETAQISSSLVREVARLGGDISAWVEPCVKAALTAALGGQHGT